MELQLTLQKQFGSTIGVEETAPNIFRIYAPFFHEDGDMLSIYLDLNLGNMCLRDFGNTLMRVAYTFDFESENKRRILNNIVKSNGGLIDNDEIMMYTKENDLSASIYCFSQIVAKVSNISILQRESGNQIRCKVYANAGTVGSKTERYITISSQA